MKHTHYQEHVKAVTQEAIDKILATSDPVKTVDNPYTESDIEYLIIAINPCKPILREVAKEKPGAYRTLTDAKEAARQILQNTITDAKTFLFARLVLRT